MLCLAGCGSSPAKAASPTPLASACTAVGAVLADGPDPGADPVGYAEAQITPLRQVHTTDPALRSAIGQLSAAYQQFFTSDGSPGAKRAETRAAAAMDRICPGSTS